MMEDNQYVYPRHQIEKDFDTKLEIIEDSYDRRFLSHKGYMYEYRKLMDWYGKTLRIHGYSRV